MDELIISDADGAWLTLRGAVLDWNRSALLRGRVEVEELSAEEIIMPRLPLPAEEPVETSDAQASGFSLPELPVSIRIDKLAIERAEIGEPVIGQDVVATLAGSMRLANGEGEADLDLRRTDGRTGVFSVQGAYSNASDALTIDVALRKTPAASSRRWRASRMNLRSWPVFRAMARLTISMPPSICKPMAKSALPGRWNCAARPAADANFLSISAVT